MPAPPWANLPAWTRCQSLAKPSCAEYWHIGEMTMRLRISRPRNCNGLNSMGGRWLAASPSFRIACPGSVDEDKLGLRG